MITNKWKPLAVSVASLLLATLHGVPHNDMQMLPRGELLQVRRIARQTHSRKMAKVTMNYSWCQPREAVVSLSFSLLYLLRTEVVLSNKQLTILYRIYVIKKHLIIIVNNYTFYKKYCCSESQNKKFAKTWSMIGYMSHDSTCRMLCPACRQDH